MKKICVYMLVLFVISLLVLSGCTKTDKSIEDQKKEGEQQVCLPGDQPADDAAKESEAKSDLTGKVTEEIKAEIPDVIDEEAETEDAEDSDEETAVETEDAEEEAPAEETNEQDVAATKTFTEGEFVRLTPIASDEDMDKISFTFTSPLNEKGEWQTKEGDGGTYYITVTADDGKTKVSKKVKLVIVPKNKAPVIEIAPIIETKEGATFTLSPTVTDAENDKVTVKYTGWMTSATKQIGYDDKGEYKVKISASDGKQTTSKEVTIKVANTNRVPLLNKVPDVVITEGEVAVVSAKAIDGDGDTITYSYLGAPLDTDGKWATKIGDAGTYMVKIIASDGTDKDEASFLVVVKSKNKAPVITPINNMLITLNKGETKTIKLEPQVVDEDGDKLTMTYSGWMTTPTKTATYDDAGKHVVTINAYDGRDTATINVNIEINRPPEFVIE